MKSLKFCVIPFLMLVIASGCGASTEKTEAKSNPATGNISEEVANEGTNTNEKVKEEDTETSEKDTKEVTNASADEKSIADKNIDLIDILFKSEEEVLSKLGEPNDRFESEAELYLEYDGLTITIDSINQEVSQMEIKSDSYLVAGTQIGQSPDDIRSTLGMASEEAIAEEGYFELTYNIEDEDNQYSMYFAANDFRSPIDYIHISKIINEPTYTVEEAKELIQGIWILEGFLEEGKLDYLTLIDEKYISTNVGSFEEQEEYRVTAPNIIELPTYNSISGEHGWGEQNFEILEEGERLEIYYVDPITGEVREATRAVYFRYSDLTE